MVSALGLLLAACASVPEAAPAPVLPLAPAASRLIFFRPSAIVSEGRIPAIMVNGRASCLLKNGTGFAQDVLPGPVTVTAATQGSAFFGTAKLSLVAAAGQIYYVEFAPNVGAVFSPSLLVELAKGDQTGAFTITLSNPTALRTIVPVACAS